MICCKIKNEWQNAFLQFAILRQQCQNNEKLSTEKKKHLHVSSALNQKLSEL